MVDGGVLAGTGQREIKKTQRDDETLHSTSTVVGLPFGVVKHTIFFSEMNDILRPTTGRNYQTATPSTSTSFIWIEILRNLIVGWIHGGRKHDTPNSILFQFSHYCLDCTLR